MRTSSGLFGKVHGGFFQDVALPSGAPEFSLELDHFSLQRFKVTGNGFIRFFELADPCVQNTVRNSKPLGYIDNRMALVDDLFDCLVFELGGIFLSLHLQFSISVFYIIICILIWGNATQPQSKTVIEEAGSHLVEGLIAVAVGLQVPASCAFTKRRGRIRRRSRG